MVNNNVAVRRSASFLFKRSKKIMLLVLPGILLILQRSNIWDVVPVSILPLLFGIATVLIAVDIKANGQLGPWHLPAVGVLLWEIRFLTILLLDIHGALSMISLLLGILTIASFVIVVRSRAYISRLAWIPLFLLISIFFIVSISTSDQWLTVFLSWFIGWIGKVLPFLAVGFLLSKRQGADSVLFVIACEPLWLEMYLAPEGISYGIWSSLNPTIQSAWLASRILPSLFFLLMIPAISLLIDKKKRNWWIAASSLISISVIVFIHTTYLQDPSSNLSISRELIWSYFMSALWIPIILSLIIYTEPEK